MSETDDPFLSSDERNEPSIVEAGFRSLCYGCDELINPGDLITRDESGEWIHRGCDW